ncbi:MAG: hypothetical protein Tsb0018_11880 [Opitutales bacterium]
MVGLLSLFSVASARIQEHYPSVFGLPNNGTESDVPAAPQVIEFVIIIPVTTNPSPQVAHLINHIGNQAHVQAYHAALVDEDVEGSLDAMEVLLQANNVHPVWQGLRTPLATQENDPDSDELPFIRRFLEGLVRRALNDDTMLYARYEFNADALLYYAVWLHNADLVRLALDRGGNVNALRGEVFNLHAVPQDRAPGLALGLPAIIAQVALRQGGNYLNPMNFQGDAVEHSLLMFAIYFGCSRDIIQMLVDAGSRVTMNALHFYGYHTFEDGEVVTDQRTAFARRIHQATYNETYWILWRAYLRSWGTYLGDFIRTLQRADLPASTFFVSNNVL